MPDLIGAARVLDRTQILRQVFDRHALFLRRREGTSSRVSTRQASEISCVAPGERTNAGLEAARSRGKLGGRPMALSPEKIKLATGVRFADLGSPIIGG